MPPNRNFLRASPTAPPAVADTAAAWVARRDAGLTAAEERELQAWLAASPDHRAAMSRYERLWSVLDRPRGAGLADQATRNLARRASRRRRIRFSLTGASVLALVGALLLVRPAAWMHRMEPSPVESAMIVSSPQYRTLPDGSLVDLNAGAEIEVDFSAALRRIRLVRGEAHFQVTKNAERPFIVSADGVDVRAVGTAFAVKIDAATVAVVVTEGRVAVERTSQSPAPALASAGHTVVVPVRDFSVMPQVAEVSAAEIDRLLGWRGTRVELSHTRLSDAVAMLNQRNHLQLRIREPALAEARISGVIRAENPDGFVRLLEASLGVRAERDQAGDIILSRDAP